MDQTVTLTFSGTATQGTHYSVSQASDGGSKHGGPPGGSCGRATPRLRWTVTATTERYGRPSTGPSPWPSDLDGTAIGSTLDITILDDETTNTDATGQPLITGTARVGGKLTATKNTIADTDGLPVQFPDDYTFEWLRVDAYRHVETPIGTDSNNYTVLSADAGPSTIRVDVSFTARRGRTFGGSACECGDGGGRGEQRGPDGWLPRFRTSRLRSGRRFQLYGTTCEPRWATSDPRIPADLHGRRPDLTALLLPAVPASIAEEDDRRHHGHYRVTAITLTVEITVGAFAVDQHEPR